MSDEGVEIIPYDPFTYNEALDKWRNDDCICAVELVSAMPGQGVTSTFTFGRSLGLVEGLLIAHRIPMQLVRPSEWKKEFGLNIGKDKSKADKKAADIAMVHMLYPDLSLKRTERSRKDDDNFADSVLLATYARRKL